VRCRRLETFAPVRRNASAQRVTLLDDGEGVSRLRAAFMQRCRMHLHAYQQSQTMSCSSFE